MFLFCKGRQLSCSHLVGYISETHLIIKLNRVIFTLTKSKNISLSSLYKLKSSVLLLSEILRRVHVVVEIYYFLLLISLLFTRRTDI